MDISELYQIYQAHPVITTDSRDCPEGSIFLALKGASFDGNKFADMALEKGCAYVIVDEKEYAKEGDERYILVEDCLTTFKELARRWYPAVYLNRPPKNGGHRALADIIESLDELRYYRKAFMAPVPGPSEAEAKAIASEIQETSLLNKD